jgi:penicillin-binding protein 2
VEAGDERRRAQQRLQDDRRAGLLVGFQVGNRLFHNYESEAYGFIGFDQALQLSCDTFFYRVGYRFWQEYGTDETDVHARDPLVSEAEAFGFGKPTGIDLPARPVADRGPGLEARLLARDEGLLLQARPDRHGENGLHAALRPRVLPRGNHYRAGDAVNFAIGQGDTMVTPLQLARAYGALSNGGTLYEPRVAKAIVSPDGTVLRRIAPKVSGTSRRRSRAWSTSTRRCSARRRSARWPGSSAASRSTRCTSAARPARPRCSASSRRRGWRPTTRTTSWS